MHQYSVYFFFYMLFALIQAYFFGEKWSRSQVPVLLPSFFGINLRKW